MSSLRRILLIAAATSLLVACGPQNPNSRNASGQGQNAQSMTGSAQSRIGMRQGMMGRGGLQRACPDEVQKYCTQDQRKVRCLSANLDKLGAACKIALESAIQLRAEKAESKAQTNAAGQPAGNQQPADNTQQQDGEEQ